VSVVVLAVFAWAGASLGARSVRHTSLRINAQVLKNAYDGKALAGGRELTRLGRRPAARGEPRSSEADRRAVGRDDEPDSGEALAVDVARRLVACSVVGAAVKVVERVVVVRDLDAPVCALRHAEQ
jgi:hypothetical protein